MEETSHKGPLVFLFCFYEMSKREISVETESSMVAWG